MIGARELPNRATAVETSRTSHVVTSPISSHYHHHLPPPPPLRAAATAAVEPPGDCPLLGQSGVSSSISPAPNDATSPPPNATNDTPYRRHVTRPQQPQYNPPNTTPRLCRVTRPTTPTKPPHGATSQPPNDPDNPPATRLPPTPAAQRQGRHVTASNDV